MQGVILSDYIFSIISEIDIFQTEAQNHQSIKSSKNANLAPWTQDSRRLCSIKVLLFLLTPNRKKQIRHDLFIWSLIGATDILQLAAVRAKEPKLRKHKQDTSVKNPL